MNKLAIIILVSFVLASCSKNFLKEEPKDELSTNQFFTQPAHAFSAVNALYRGGAPQFFDGSHYSGSRMMLGQWMTGFFDNEYKGQEVHVQHTQQLTLNGNNLAGYIGGIWSELYRTISRANFAIKYMPTTPGLAEADMKKLTAEARFFRAYAYYYLARMFGGVPVITEPYESLENLFVARGSLKDVYQLIEDDLKYAVNEGGLAESSMANNGSRITKGTAATLLAEVYLTMSGFPLQENRYADAAAMAKSVISSNVYSLEQHERDNGGNVVLSNSAYNKLRKSDRSATEYVFYHEYTAGISDAIYPVYSLPVSMAQTTKYGITNGAYQPLPAFLGIYDNANDLRIQEKQYFHTQFTLPGGEVRTFEKTPYIWFDSTALFQTASSGKDIVAYSYSDVLLIAAEAIARAQGVTAEAADYLAQVRGRAYWKESMADIKNELGGLSADAFVEEVWKERHRELVFEFQTWFDMVRTRKYPKTNGGSNGDVTFVNLVGQATPWGKTFEEKHLLLPLPEPERQRNNQLEQNPGY